MLVRTCNLTQFEITTKRGKKEIKPDLEKQAPDRRTRSATHYDSPELASLLNITHFVDSESRPTLSSTVSAI